MRVTIHTHCQVPVKYFMYLSTLYTGGSIHRIYWLTSLYFDKSIKVAGFHNGILPVAPFKQLKLLVPIVFISSSIISACTNAM